MVVIKTHNSESRGLEEQATAKLVIYKEHRQKLTNTLAKPPWKLAPSPNMFLLHKINKPTMVEIGTTVL